MARDTALQTPVQLTPALVELAETVTASIAAQEKILVRSDEQFIDWSATSERVLETATYVYFSLLVIQAKREQRSIGLGMVELARWRRDAIACLAQLRGKRPTADEMLSELARMAGIDTSSVQPLTDPVRRDLARLQGSRIRKASTASRVPAVEAADRERQAR